MSTKAHSSYTIVDVIDGLQWQGNLSEAPSNPKQGWAYYNTTTTQSYIYDGEQWVVFAKDGTSGDGVTDRVTQYYESDSRNEQINGEWSENFPTSWVGKTYIWTRIKETWTCTDENGNIVVKYSTPQLMSNMDLAINIAAKQGVSVGEWCAANDVVIVEDGMIAVGSIKSDKLEATTLSAIRADMGEIKAGSIESKRYIDGAKVIVWGAMSPEEPITSTGLAYTPSSDGTYYSVIGIGTCTDSHIIIPSMYNDKPVKSIAKDAFSKATIQSITIPNSVTIIGISAFANCSKLESVVIPNSVITIEKSAFYSCDTLSSVVIGRGVTTIGTNAFAYCDNLANLIIGNNVMTIGDLAFEHCISLTSVIIPQSVTSIGVQAFINCNNLTIYCEATSQPSGWESNWNASKRPVYWYSEMQPTTSGNYWHRIDGEGFKISCNDEYMIRSPHFKVAQDGKIEASDVYLEGEIRADIGYIGNLHINESGDLASTNFQIYNEVEDDKAYSMLRLADESGTWSTTLSSSHLSVPSVSCTQLEASSGYIGKLTTATFSFDTVTRTVNGVNVNVGRMIFGNSSNNAAIEFVPGNVKQHYIRAVATAIHNGSASSLNRKFWIRVDLYQNNTSNFYYAESAIKVGVRGNAALDNEECNGVITIQPGTYWGYYNPCWNNWGIKDAVYVTSIDGYNAANPISTMYSSQQYPETTESTIQVVKTTSGTTTSKILI